jgi:uncharacterized protein YbjT (DUF2867 family)
VIPAPAALSVVMVGATGAVGGHAARALAALPQLARLTLLGRRAIEDLRGPAITQHVVDVLDPASYAGLLPGHDAAICAMGVGQPAKLSPEEFSRIERTGMVDFASACKRAGVSHFELLASLGADARSRMFYLRTKGQTEDDIRALGFARTSFFHPSMILTPRNRYGFAQAVVLRLWPLLNPLLVGPLRKARGIRVEQLGRAMAANLLTAGPAREVLTWDDFVALAPPRLDTGR